MRSLIRAAIPRPLRNVLRHPGATLRWAWDDLAFRLGRTPVVSVTGEWTVRCHPSSRIVFEVHRDHPEHRDELAWFARTATPGMVLVDVGAHVGIFTLAALHYGGSQSRVVAVEPSRAARRVLAANVRLAGASDRVTIVDAALGAHRGTLAVLTTGAGGFHQLMRPAGNRADASPVRVETLDQLVGDQAMTHVKIDVEGFERAVLEGGRGVLAARRPIVLLELHGTLLRQAGDDPAGVLALLTACGYRTFETHGSPVSPTEAAAASLIRLVCRG